MLQRAYVNCPFQINDVLIDHYKLLEDLHFRREKNKVIQLHKEFDYNYAFMCGKVATYVVVALKTFQHDHQQLLNEQNHHFIEEYIDALIYADLSIINSIVKKANLLMMAFGYNYDQRNI